MNYQRVDIPGYEGMYQIDTEGIVWALPRQVVKASGWVKDAKPFNYRGKCLKPIQSRTSPYWSVHLYNEQHRRATFDISMILAHVFLGCPVMKNDGTTGDVYRTFLKSHSEDYDYVDLRVDNIFWKQTKRAGERIV